MAKEHDIAFEGENGPFCSNCGDNAALGGPCPIRVLSLGAGVQSTTLLMMMIEGEIQKADHAVFSDTGWEPRAVYEHLESLIPLMEKAGIQFHRVRRGDIQTDGLADLPWFIRNPDGSKGMGRRQCTSKYKLDPLKNKQRELAGLAPYQRSKHHLITTIIGISWDESHRMKDPFYNWIQNEYPLVDRRITRQDCLDWMEAKGFPRPPRSSCLGCPFHSNDEWRYIKENYPDEFEETARIEEEAQRDPAKLGLKGVPYLHRQMVSIRDLDLRTEQEKGVMSLFEMECEGMCGL